MKEIMSKNSLVKLAHHAFNPWWGYKKFPLTWKLDGLHWIESQTDPAGYWESHAQSRFLSDEHWNTPLPWNSTAEHRNQRERVLCAPTPDLFQDHDDLPGWRSRLLNLIEATPNLDWLLLTRHAYAIKRHLPQGYTLPRNAWLGVHVPDQHRADRYIPYLQAVPTDGVRFLYCEPLRQPIDIRRYLEPRRGIGRIDWVVCGGQSTNGAEPMHPGWVEYLQWQCEQAGVPFYFKQWGNWAPVEVVGIEAAGNRHVIEMTRCDGRPEDMVRVGKRVAGRVLFGQTWEQFPESRPL